MFASKRSSSLIVRAAVLVAIPLVLAACSALGPGPMPTGYAHHGSQYKAQPGPRPLLIKDGMLDTQDREVKAYHPNSTGVAGMPVMNEPMMGSTAAWQPAATDLVGRLVGELGKPMENVYVVPGAYPDLEQALRDAMMARGVAVATAQGTGPFTMQYVVTPVTNSSMVSITLMSVGAAVKEVSGVYDVGTAPAMSAMPVMPVEAAAPSMMTPNPPSDIPMPIMPLTTP